MRKKTVSDGVTRLYYRRNGKSGIVISCQYRNGNVGVINFEGRDLDLTEIEKYLKSNGIAEAEAERSFLSECLLYRMFGPMMAKGCEYGI